jgi:cardiolipin synthase
MNLPNAITIIRILLIPLFLYKVIQGEMVFATIVYLTAAVSDGLDGFIARFWNLKTKLGTFLDPMADKLLVTASFLSLSMIKIVPLWITLAVISRDIIIVGGSLLIYLIKHELTIRPQPIGKVTTFFQFSYILLVLLGSAFVIPFLSKLYNPMLLITGGLTIISLAVYILDGVKALED